VPALRALARDFVETLAPPAPSAAPPPLSAMRPTAPAPGGPPPSIPGAPRAPSSLPETLLPPAMDEEDLDLESARSA
jgi:hypothetical protein